MNKEVIESMKEYISTEGIELELDFDEDKIKEIKKDAIKLADIFQELFQPFRKHFTQYVKDFNDGSRNLEEYITEMSFIDLEIERIKISNFGHEYKTKKLIMEYVFSKRYEILDFFDLCMEVYGE